MSMASKSSPSSGSSWCCLMSRNDFLADHAEAMRRTVIRYLAREREEKNRKIIPWRARRS